MNRIHSLILVLAAALLFGSCSRHDDVDPRQVLLGQLGPDFRLAAFVNPEEIARSAGEKSIEQLHRTDSRFFQTVYDAEGLDKSLALVLSYAEPRQEAVAMAVTDPDDLAKSLEKQGWKRDAKDGDTQVFTCDRPEWQIVCDGQVMWVVSPRDGQNALQTVEALKARRADIPAWMARRFEECKQQTVAFCTPYRNDSHLFGWAKLKDASMSLTVGRIDDSDGLRIGLFGTAGLRRPGAVLDALDPDADLALVLALPKSVSLADLLDRYVFSGNFVPREIRAAASRLDGRAALSVKVNDPGNPDAMDFDNYRAALALGTDSARASSAVDALRGLVPSSMFSLRTDGPDAFMISTPGYPGQVIRPKSLTDNDIVWLRLNLPAGSPLLTNLGIDCGIRANGHVRVEEAHLDITFTDSKEGFVATMLKFLTAID